MTAAFFSDEANEYKSNRAVGMTAKARALATVKWWTSAADEGGRGFVPPSECRVEGGRASLRGARAVDDFLWDMVGTTVLCSFFVRGMNVRRSSRHQYRYPPWGWMSQLWRLPNRFQTQAWRGETITRIYCYMYIHNTYPTYRYTYYIPTCLK
jgi:hypothetical protein